MIRQIFIIIIFIGGYLSSPVFAVGQGQTFKLLREPAVKWSHGRLKGEVKNAPVKNLIVELLQKTDTKGTHWEVIGNLKGSISVSFDDLTIDESLKKIMRLNRFNYTVIFDERQPQDTHDFHRINELAIYQEDHIVRFSRTAKQKPSARMTSSRGTNNAINRGPTTRLPVPTPADKPKIRKSPRSEPTKNEIAAFNKEMRAIAEELLAEEKISQEEYKKLIKNIESEKKE